MTELQVVYQHALEIKCPFFRRRASDLLDTADMVLRFLAARHKSILPPAVGDAIPKRTDATTAELCAGLRADWCSAHAYDHPMTADERRDGMSEVVPRIRRENVGYYITGKLNTSMYRNDCLFDGPDPDMPVRGLRKYLSAASQLFDARYSTARLLSLHEAQEDEDIVIVAHWCIEGVLRLPWKPRMPCWTGTTSYYVNPEERLIYKHIETWDISVFQAFGQTLLPKDITAKLWKT